MGKEIVTEAFVAMRLRLHNMACGILRDRAEADDAVQEAFCRLWESPASGDNVATRRRLVAVVRNLCIDRLRRRITMQACAVSDAEAAACEPALHFDVEAIRLCLLRELPPMQREVFRLVALEDYDYDEVAVRLGISEEAARANMSRARKKLRDVYRKYEL
ncbi:MAG: sigma-70 family RNA polymerase sigma factor [Muribaculaceae bacterium]|nr:sigma-70 family RNA polymerase sigma factor [Muribaculaceae bacterium]